MNAETLFEMIEKQIKDIQPWMVSRFHICRWEGGFRYLPKSHITIPHDIFGTYNRKLPVPRIISKTFGRITKDTG